MTVTPTPDYAQLIRTISIPAGTTPVATDIAVPTVRFRCQLSPAKERRASDQSPRETEPRRLLRWSNFSVRDTVLVAGCRLDINGISYELMSDPKPISRGFRSYGEEVDVVPVDDLYPHVASVTTQDSAVVGITAVALWAPRERHEERGDYEDRDGEAPIEAASLIFRNVSLVIGTERWRVLTPSVQVYPPRVVFAARRSGG